MRIYMKGTVVIEYVWLDSVSNLRSKSRTVGKEYFIDILIFQRINY